MKTVLSIAGSDCSGGAGIQADIKTITAHKLYAMTAITALTAQNTTGVYGVLEAEPDFLEKQLDCIFTDIYPDAVKIGMVSSAPLIKAIARSLLKYRAKNIIIDPVMVSTSGSRLLSEDAAEALTERLLPLGAVITPNLPEAEVLCGFPLPRQEDMQRAGAELAAKTKTAVLIKGGHLAKSADDLLCMPNGSSRWFTGSRIETQDTHGTGCTLSSAIACGLARGFSIESSVQRAKEYVSGALSDGLRLGSGSGPLNHMWQL